MRLVKKTVDDVMGSRVNLLRMLYNYCIMAKPMNMKRRMKALETYEEPGDEAVLEMMLSFRNRRHRDRKREASRRGCRNNNRYTDDYDDYDAGYDG